MTLSLAGPLLLVGAGKMGGAMLEGWLRQGLDPALVFIQDPAPPPEVAALAARHAIAAGTAPDLPAPPSVIVVAVKPDLLPKLMPEIEPMIGEKQRGALHRRGPHPRQHGAPVAAGHGHRARHAEHGRLGWAQHDRRLRQCRRQPRPGAANAACCSKRWGRCCGSTTRA